MSQKPTRAERERELRAMMGTDAGNSRIVELYKQAAGMPMGQVPPVGMLMSQMIATILDKEYGPQS